LFQVAVLLPQRDDDKFCTGQLTYTSSIPVEVTVLELPLTNETAETQPLSVPGLNASIAALAAGEPRKLWQCGFHRQ
jgi:hypothetical protein